MALAAFGAKLDELGRRSDRRDAIQSERLFARRLIGPPASAPKPKPLVGSLGQYYYQLIKSAQHFGSKQKAHKMVAGGRPSERRARCLCCRRHNLASWQEEVQPANQAPGATSVAGPAACKCPPEPSHLRSGRRQIIELPASDSSETCKPNWTTTAATTLF